VVLDRPTIELHPLSELKDSLAVFIKGEVASVHQLFKGSISGDALLLLNYEGAVALANLLNEPPTRPMQLNTSDREVLTEVGNILLNACLGTFGNLLRVHISFAVPRLHLEALAALLDTMTINEQGLRYALLVFTNFRLRDSQITGYLVIVLGVASLDRLIREIEKLG
jgi:chemotaxis protein CheC